jgi:hypothetical protein
MAVALAGGAAVVTGCPSLVIHSGHISAQQYLAAPVLAKTKQLCLCMQLARGGEVHHQEHATSGVAHPHLSRGCCLGNPRGNNCCCMPTCMNIGNASIQAEVHGPLDTLNDKHGHSTCMCTACVLCISAVTWLLHKHHPLLKAHSRRTSLQWHQGEGAD